jgi:hypothetical protein
MRLGIDDETKENPTPEDIERMVPDAPPNEDFIAFLERSDDVWIEGEATPDGRFHVSRFEGPEILNGTRDVDGRELRELFKLYLAGDDRFRQRMTWKAWDPKAAPASTGGGKQVYWPVIVLPGVGLLLLVALPLFGDWIAGLPWERLPLPDWMKTTPALLVQGFFVACVLLFLVAVVVKLVEARRMARWPRTMGRITKSEQGFALTRTSGENIPRNERVANIAYTFEVDGREYTGHRFTLAERVPEDEVGEILARYPKGKLVPVFYNPTDPEDSTLERDVPKGALLGCLAMLVFGIVGVVGIVFGASMGPAMVTSAFPKAHAPLVLISGGIGVVLLLVAVGLLKSSLAARKWPKTTGTVTLSEVHDFELARNRSRPSVSYGSSRQAKYMPVVEYSYKVAGKTHTSRMVRLDTEVAGSRAYAEKLASRYPAGKIVRVLYDPTNPSRAALEVHSEIGWVILAIAVVCLAVAARATAGFGG